MIDTRYKPPHLPQMNAPFIYVLDKLEKDGVEYNIKKSHPSDLIPSQGIVALDKISSIDMKNIKPIWTAMNNEILDGHHRYGAALSHDIPLRHVQIMLNAKDAVRVLNKIQDIFEYEQQSNIEEVVSQNIFNTRNGADSGISDSEFLATLEGALDDDKREILHSGDEGVVGKKKKMIIGYRRTPIVDNSKIGNFFTLEPIEGYKKYEIEFDNLLDTNDMDAIFQKGISPVFILAKKWFPNIEFDKIGKKYKINSDALINRAVAEKALVMGYDGIKYGDIIIQGLK